MDANMLGKQPGDKPLETSICQIDDKLPMLNIITPIFSTKFDHAYKLSWIQLLQVFNVPP